MRKLRGEGWKALMAGTLAAALFAAGASAAAAQETEEALIETPEDVVQMDVTGLEEAFDAEETDAEAEADADNETEAETEEEIEAEVDTEAESAGEADETAEAETEAEEDLGLGNDRLDPAGSHDRYSETVIALDDLDISVEVQEYVAGRQEDGFVYLYTMEDGYIPYVMIGGYEGTSETFADEFTAYMADNYEDLDVDEVVENEAIADRIFTRVVYLYEVSGYQVVDTRLFSQEDDVTYMFASKEVPELGYLLEEDYLEEVAGSYAHLAGGDDSYAGHIDSTRSLEADGPTSLFFADYDAEAYAEDAYDYGYDDYDAYSVEAYEAQEYAPGQYYDAESYDAAELDIETLESMGEGASGASQAVG